MAFWFDLQLDDEEELSTSPYGAKGQTWQQAVQYFEEIKVEKGGMLPLLAKHDTYGITFQVREFQCSPHSWGEVRSWLLLGLQYKRLCQHTALALAFRPGDESLFECQGDRALSESIEDQGTSQVEAPRVTPRENCHFSFRSRLPCERLSFQTCSPPHLGQTRHQALNVGRDDTRCTSTGGRRADRPHGGAHWCASVRPSMARDTAGEWLTFTCASVSPPNYFDPGSKHAAEFMRED